MTTLEPFAVLHESEGLPAFALPAELQRLYGGEIGFGETCLFANFVVTIDGVAAITTVPRSNVLISDASESDRFLMGLLRACADVVLVGSGTIHASSNRHWTADAVYPPAGAEYGDLRRRLCRPPHPELAIVTRTGSLDVTHPALEAGALVLTTRHGETKLRGRLPGATQLIALGEDNLDLGIAVAQLQARGLSRILSEGGPTIFGALVAAHLVDELFLTISPLLAGRSGGENGRLALVENAVLLPLQRAYATLLGVRAHGAHLFLRYGFAAHGPQSQTRPPG